MSGAMAPRQKLKKGRPLEGFPNQGPTVIITASQSPVPQGQASEGGEFTATATDPEQGDIAASLVWSTSADGNFGTGAAPILTFGSSGEGQALTASVVDGFGEGANDVVFITVTGV
jgi:hypothetical protein